MLGRLSTPSALASLGLYVAAGGHVIAMLTHLSHGWNIAAFFLACAALQVVAAGRVARRGRPGVPVDRARGGPGPRAAPRSRTMTLPFGGVHTVHNDRPQDADLPGTVVVAAELLTLATARRCCRRSCGAGPRTRCCWSASASGRPGASASCERRPHCGRHPDGDPARRTGRLRGALHTASYTAVVLALLLVSGLLPFQTIRVPSASMTPTVAPGDHLLLDKRRPTEVAVGDVVVLHDPLDPGDLLVKRVIAVGGDSVGFEDGVLVRNGRPVTSPTRRLPRRVYYGPDVVPPGMLYVLGDNRVDSVDSRQFGPVPLAAVVGRVDARLFPVPGFVTHTRVVHRAAWYPADSRRKEIHMAADDKIDAKADQLKGQVKEGVGRATDDRDLEAEGHGDQAKGNIKQAGEKIKDVFKS